MQTNLDHQRQINARLSELIEQENRARKEAGDQLVVTENGGAREGQEN